MRKRNLVKISISVILLICMLFSSGLFTVGKAVLAIGDENYSNETTGETIWVERLQTRSDGNYYESSWTLDSGNADQIIWKYIAHENECEDCNGDCDSYEDCKNCEYCQSLFEITLYCLDASKQVNDNYEEGSFEEEYQNATSGLESLFNGDEDLYYELRWLFDNFYVSERDTEYGYDQEENNGDFAEEDAVREGIVQEAVSWYNYSDNYDQYIDEENISDWLTNDEVEVVQQMAIWYFTNDLSGAESSSFANIIQANGESIESNRDQNQTAYQMEALYEYLINFGGEELDTIKAEYEELDEGVNPEEDLSINLDNAQINFDGEEYKIGPITVTGDKLYAEDVTITSGESSSEITINDEDIQEENGYYYITISSEDGITEGAQISISIEIEYIEYIFWDDEADENSQPLIELQRDTAEDSITLTVPSEEETSYRVTKVWNDEDNEYELRPQEITVMLYKEVNGELVEVTEEDLVSSSSSAGGNGEEGTTSFQNPVTLNDENNWGHTWTGLKKYETNGENGESTEEKTEVKYVAREVVENNSSTEGEEEVIEEEATEGNNSNYTIVEEGGMYDENYQVSYEDADNSTTITNTNTYIPPEFDLSLRKFISSVDGVAPEVSREPVVDITYLADGTATTAIYNHTKEPVFVTKDSTIVYTIRVYNEGDVDGYASEIKDHLPEYLQLVEDSEINEQYGWELSEDGRTVTTRYLENELLSAFDGTTLDYADVQIECKLTDTAISNEYITNIAEISEYQDEEHEIVNPDRDSESDNVDLPEDEDLPNYKEEEIESGESYIPGQEDDDDFEKIYFQEFDLALLKYVTQVIVIEDGVETITQTGNVGDENDIIPKVEIDRKKLDTTTVKFVYTIKITNEGDIAGYATEITDDIPEGLRFVAEDNPQWTEVDGYVTTRALENTLLQPGESATVDIVFTWINGEDNLGLKINTAEITEDYNDKDIPDRDSTPGNWTPGEDDIDTAEVLLSIKTGAGQTYVVLALAVLITMASGIVIVKKFML